MAGFHAHDGHRAGRYLTTAGNRELAAENPTGAHHLVAVEHRVRPVELQDLHPAVLAVVGGFGEERPGEHPPELGEVLAVDGPDAQRRVSHASSDTPPWPLSQLNYRWIDLI